MKKIKLIMAFFMLLCFTNCLKTVPIKQEFFRNTKVGVLIQINNDPQVIRGDTYNGTRIINDTNNKFYVALSHIKSNLDLKKALKTEISNILTSKNKSFVILSDNFNEASLTKFEAPETFYNNPDHEIYYPKYDFRNIRKTHNVDEILFVKVHDYGLLLLYSGVLLASRSGHVVVDTQIINLKNNSLLQQRRFESNVRIKGGIKSDENYQNLQNAIQEAIDRTISKLKSKLK
ncbi:MAG TPA: hypothetical protein DDZ41_02350 [Flavobacterium sp.]|nr:hypothetical protein [Flavobacterium sp.]